MEPQEIVEKVTAGELSGEKLSEVMSQLEPDKAAEVKRLAAESASQDLEKASALRKERNRVEQQKTEAEKEAEEAAERARALAAEKDGQGEDPQPANPQNPPADNTMSQFRLEQVEKAKNKFKATFTNLPDEQYSEVFKHFEKIDSGKVDSDNIYQDLVGAYAYVNRDALVAADAEKRQREAEAAAEAAASASGANGAPPQNGNEPNQYPKHVTDLAKEAGISPEAAAKVATEGNKRVYQ